MSISKTAATLCIALSMGSTGSARTAKTVIVDGEAYTVSTNSFGVATVECDGFSASTLKTLDEEDRPGFALTMLVEETNDGFVRRNNPLGDLSDEAGTRLVMGCLSDEGGLGFVLSTEDGDVQSFQIDLNGRVFRNFGTAGLTLMGELQDVY